MHTSSLRLYFYCFFFLFLIPSNPLIAGDLVYSTYFGGSQSEVPGAIAVDSEGNFYVTGSTGSSDFPLLNPVQEEFAGGGATLGDVFVVKMDPRGKKVFFSTFLGGEGTDIGRSIAVDSSGQVYVTGTTFSSDFPSTPGAYQEECSGQCPFVFKLSADGKTMLYSTFIGRGDGLAVAVDQLGQAVVTGKTSSSSFPLKNAFQTERAGQFDAFVTKLTSEGNDLVFSTYFGGSGDENLIGRSDIAVDDSGNVFLTGRTDSQDFPTLEPLQSVLGGEEDVFVSKFSPQGSLVYSTYLGGGSSDVGNGIDIDEAGNVFVAGTTESSDFPTRNPFQAEYAGGILGDAFVAKISSNGSDLLFSTYLGGESGDTANDIAVDELGRAVIVGNGSSDFPLKDPMREFEGIDNFVAKFSDDGSELVYSTAIGAGDADIAVAAHGTNVYVTGNISNGTLPLFKAFQPRTGGFQDVFFTQISDSGKLYFAQFGNGRDTVSEILLTNSSSASPSNATLEFRDDDGNPVAVGMTINGDSVSSQLRETASEISLVVPPLGMTKITTDGIGDIVTGSVTVSYDIPLGGVIRFGLNPFGITGVNQSELVRGFITPVRRTSINTGIAIQNTEDKPVGITLRLRGFDGEQIQGGLTSLTLPAFGHLARFIDELFTSADLENFEGTLTVEVGSALSDLITATALELGTKPGEFTTLPVTPIP